MRLSVALTTLLFAGLLVTTAPAAAQSMPEPPEKQVHEVPFASEGNVIKLTVANGTEMPLWNVHVTAAKQPAWMELKQSVISLEKVGSGEEAPVRFRFSVAEGAPVGHIGTLRIEITSAMGTAEHEIRVEVAPPKRFELLGNYPNPFSRGTTISYNLLADGHVRVNVYDVLGRRVAVIADERQEAGRRGAHFDAAGLSSGLYFYRVEAGNHVQTGRMVLVR